MCDALAAELEARGDALRTVVFCDSERPPRMPDGSPLALTGGGRGLLAAAGADDRLFGLRPVLVTAETVAVPEADAAWWLARLEAELGAGGAARAPTARLGRTSVAGVRVAVVDGLGHRACSPPARRGWSSAPAACSARGGTARR